MNAEILPLIRPIGHSQHHRLPIGPLIRPHQHIIQKLLFLRPERRILTNHPPLPNHRRNGGKVDGLRLRMPLHAAEKGQSPGKGEEEEDYGVF